MAHLAIAAGCSVNGVARLHTEILKNQELREFYEMYPYKFNVVVIADHRHVVRHGAHRLVSLMDKAGLSSLIHFWSMEFLMGRALGNNLINMTAYKEVKDALDEIGFDPPWMRIRTK